MRDLNMGEREHTLYAGGMSGVKSPLPFPPNSIAAGVTGGMPDVPGAIMAAGESMPDGARLLRVWCTDGLWREERGQRRVRNASFWLGRKGRKACVRGHN
jgi:hypothetical protein